MSGKVSVARYLATLENGPTCGQVMLGAVDVWLFWPC